MKNKLPLLVPLLFLMSCIEGTDPFFWNRPSENAPIYVPVYGNADDLLKINKLASKPIERPAKIFTYNDFLIVNIKNEGFHVIDNSNPSLPKNLFFIEVPGNNDVAIKDGVIYADNYQDIVAFTVEANGEIQIVERMKNIIQTAPYPPFTNVYFECADPNKGVVVDWVLGNIEDPKCYR